MANKMTTSNGMNLAIGMTFNTQQARQDLNTKLRQLEQKAIVKTTVEIDGERFVKTIRTYQDSMKNLVEETTLWNGAGKQMTSTITNLTNAEERVNAQIAQQERITKSLTQSQNKLNSVTKRSVSVFTDFANTFLKMAKFNTINLIYDSFTSSVSNAVQIVEEFNKATTELKKVSDLEGESLKAYSEDLSEYGDAVGRTLTDMVNSATIFKRTGATDEEAAKLAQISELYRNVADNEITSAEASSFLVSQIKAFNMTADDSIHVIDAINETANHYAVSTNDLQTALTKSAAAMATAGNTYEETIALVEAGTSVMQGQAGTVGNGLRTIAINIANLATKSEEFVAANGKVKISLKDEKGEIKSTYQILNELSKSWDKLNRAEQNEIATTLAGKTRYNVLTSVMRNFTDAQNVLESAINSTNSAWEENARYMESIEAKQAKLQAEVQKFVIGDGGLEDLIKHIVDIGTATMKFINSIGGLQTVLTAIITMLTIGLIPAGATLLTNISNMISSVGVLATNFITAYKGGYSFSMALDAIGVSGITATTAVQGLVAVIGLAVIAFNTYQQAQEKARKAAYESEQTALEQVATIQQQIKSLSDENKSRSDLIKAIQAIDDAYKDEGQSIDELNKKRQESIDKLKEEAQLKLEDAEREGFTQFKKDVKTVNTGYNFDNDTLNKFKTWGVELDNTNLSTTIASLNNLRDVMHKNNVETSQLDAITRQLQSEYNNAKTGIEQYNAVLLKQGKVYDFATGEVRELLPEVAAAFNQTADITEEQIDILNELGVSLNDVNEKFSESDADKFYEALTNQDIETARQLLEQYGLTVNEVVDQQDELSAMFDNVISPLSDIENNYSLLNKAMKEFNTQGGISSSTLKKLTELDTQWLNLLTLENGQLVINKTEVANLANMEKQEAIATLQAQAAQDMLNVALGNFDALSPFAQQAIQDIATESKKSADEAIKEAAAYDLARDAYIKKEMAKGSYKGDPNEATNYIDAIADRYQQYLDKLNGWNLDMVDSTKSAASSHKDAWVEAFEEEQRLLKHSLEMNEITEYEYYERLKDLNEQYFGEISGNHEKYLKEYQENEEEIYKGMKAIYDKVKDYLYNAVVNSYEKAIKALQKEEKQVLAEIKKQIDALKKEKEKVIKGIEDEIKALKKQKEAVQKYFNDQIDAIKKENEVLQQQNQLLEYQQQLAQAKAKKVMIMQDGRFQLGEDESAVAQAEQNLSEYQDQLSYEQQIEQLEELRDATVETLEERIEALEEYKEYMTEYYDEQIEAMEEYYEQVQEQYEKQIEALQEQLDAFKEGYRKAEDLENARLAAEVMGANEEAAIWQARLENLAAAVTEYNRLLSLLGEEGVGASSNYSFNGVSHNPIDSVGSIDTSVKRRASGDASFSGNEIALVGESPNTELVLGSKLNRSLGGGQLVNLSKGSGVVNAESTSTLAGLLNGLASPTTNVANNRSTQQNFNFGTITLPNVTDADSFVNTLSHKFNNYAIQYGNVRK